MIYNDPYPHYIIDNFIDDSSVKTFLKIINDFYNNFSPLKLNELNKFKKILDKYGYVFYQYQTRGINILLPKKWDTSLKGIDVFCKLSKK